MTQREQTTAQPSRELCPEHEYLANAVGALGDRLADAELRACEEVLKTEFDVQRRRVAATRYVQLSARKEAA